MKKTTLLILSYLVSITSFSQDIATARSQGIGSTVTVSGIVTNGDELGIIRYIEDVTGGIAIYDLTTNNYLNGAVRGDSITITGLLVDYNGLLEMNPNSPAIIHSTGNILPSPQIINPSQIGETTESELIRIDNAIFSQAGNMFTNTTYDFISNGQQGKIFINANSPLLGTFIPGAPVSIIGISSQYTFSVPANDGYQILPRDTIDLILPTNIMITSSVIQNNITTNSFELSWNTSMNGTTNCYYGTTNLLGNTINNGGSSTSHSITLSGLQPATVYYVQCFSINGSDTAFSNIGVYSTSSNSSGKIRPYFNHTVDNSFSTGVDAQNITTYFNDTIKAYMDLAQNTLDICVYNASDATIATGINDAYNRGVQVRYIADDDVTNSMLNSLDPNIPIVYRNPAIAGIMHNKFIIIDVNSVTNSWILSGSTNWTNPSNLFNDYNNLIFIQDQTLAKAYTLEFEEMWAGTFGHYKEDNTPHLFNVNGTEIELYFSPSDQTTTKIIEFINDVDYTLEFGLLSFTKNDIGDAVIDKKLTGFNIGIRGIIEQQNVTGSEYDNLIANGVNVKSHTGVTHQFHHKYAIADANITGSNPSILTGSHNWSANAENNSDENTLIIHDATIANIYLQEFEKRWGELSSTEIESLNNIRVELFPNPSDGKINIFSEEDIDRINIYSVNGDILNSTTLNSFTISSSGTYFIKVFLKNGKSTIRKVMIQ